MTALFAWLQPTPSPSPPVTWLNTDELPSRARLPVSCKPMTRFCEFSVDEAIVLDRYATIPSFLSSLQEAPPSMLMKIPPSVPNMIVFCPRRLANAAAWQSACTYGKLSPGSTWGSQSLSSVQVFPPSVVFAVASSPPR